MTRPRGPRLAEFFPLGTDGQRTILPRQRELLQSSERYVMFVGGYGSGKTLAAAVAAVLLSLSVPGNVGVVVRRSYQKLHDSTWRILLSVLERVDLGDLTYHDRFQGFPHRIVFPNGSEIWAKESKDIGRWLGSEFGWAWVDEAQEEPLKTFEGLVSRLRLPQASSYLKFIGTTNPPFLTHWIPKVFGTEPGAIKRGGASYRLIRGSSRDNPNLPSDYVANLVTTYGEGNARRIIDGEFGFTPEGLPVYGDAFAPARHVGEPRFLETVDLDRAWDWGFRVPVCTWHQIYRCPRGTVHWNILHELIGEREYTEQFAQKVLDETRTEFPLAIPALIRDCGDAAGALHNERGPGPIIRLSRQPWNLRFKYRTVKVIDPWLDLIRKQLRAPSCACGWYAVLIHRSCRNVIDALTGGYHYPEKPEGEAALKPLKDGYFDNIADSIRYEAMNRLAPELRDGGKIDALVDPLKTVDGFAPVLGLDPWSAQVVSGAVEFAKGTLPEETKAVTSDWWRDS